MIGTSISHYEVLEELGRGGMGILYRARDIRLERMVAIKVLHAEAVSSADRRQRFVREAQAASALNHPHIVTVHEIDRAGTNGVEHDFIVRGGHVPPRLDVIKGVLDWLDQYLGPVTKKG